MDLAGSEKFKIPQDLTKEEKDLRINELTSINGSLSCLGHCISALIEKSRTHIPFRNSKLTRVLSDSLSGNGKIWFIVCISPSVSSASETLSTLQVKLILILFFFAFLLLILILLFSFFEIIYFLKNLISFIITFN